MNRQKIFQKLVPLVSEVTGARPGQIRLDTYLIRDLGAESIDLLDLSFLIEETFGVMLEPDELESRARQALGDQPYQQEGRLTPEALEQLRKALPEVDPALFREDLRKVEVPSVLNVAVFVRLIDQKLNHPVKETDHA
jgi:acyl carrier protein